MVARAAEAAYRVVGPEGARVVERGAARLERLVPALPPARLALAHGDWMPKHLMVDGGAIVGVIDWEFAGPASPAFDLARWEVSAGAPFDDLGGALREGYARVADPDAAAGGWVAAHAIDWAVEVLGWRNPADPAHQRRCVDLIARYAAS